MDIKVRKRKKKINPCPNPLFVRWLTEWRDEAATKGWKSQHTYSRALTSLKKYPLPFKTAQEAKILEHFGDKICKMLEDKLLQYNATGSLTCNTLSSALSEAPKVFKPTDEPKQKKLRKTSDKEYIPAYRSGAYALLLALYQFQQKSGNRISLMKTELQQLAQPYADKSFTLADPGSFYTAWSSMKTLITKNMVIKKGNPCRYYITESGCKLACKLQAVHNATENSKSSQFKHNEHNTVQRNCNGITKFIKECDYWFVNNDGCKVNTKDEAAICIDDETFVGYLTLCKKESLLKSGKYFKQDFSKQINESGFIYAYLHEDHIQEIENGISLPVSGCSQDSPSNSSQESTAQIREDFILHPHQFDIVLCIDNTETCGGISRKLNLLPELTKNGVNFSVRKLHVGDFLWIAKEKVNVNTGQLHLPKSKELVLNYVIERKREDDLVKSIMDGRFHEQKFRLKNCGLHYLIYLVEEYGSFYHHGISEMTLQQAITNTQITDGFYIKRTHNQKESVAYLTIMTRYLQSFYKNKSLISCTKENFEKLQGKSQISDSQQVLLLFEEFNCGSIKNRMMTVTEVFICQLVQFYGLSTDKAIAIVDQYKTPSQLLEAYENCDSDVERDKLLMNIKFGRFQRIIGLNLSKIVSMMYCTKGPLS